MAAGAGSHPPLRPNEVDWIIMEKVQGLTPEGALARDLIVRLCGRESDWATTFVVGLKPQYDRILLEALQRAEDPIDALAEFSRQSA